MKLISFLAASALVALIVSVVTAGSLWASFAILFTGLIAVQGYKPRYYISERHALAHRPKPYPRYRAPAKFSPRQLAGLKH
ncbi:MAG TPA: hypothetical protein VFT72_08880 [Opitutaceae bacterium]|nr:hypothetical protein [Opitutaceae bacterium]